MIDICVLLHFISKRDYTLPIFPTFETFAIILSKDTLYCHAHNQGMMAHLFPHRALRQKGSNAHWHHFPFDIFPAGLISAALLFHIYTFIGFCPCRFLFRTKAPVFLDCEQTKLHTKPPPISPSKSKTGMTTSILKREVCDIEFLPVIVPPMRCRPPTGF